MTSKIICKNCKLEAALTVCHLVCHPVHSCESKRVEYGHKCNNNKCGQPESKFLTENQSCSKS